jgi:hypothetical protein
MADESGSNSQKSTGNPNKKFNYPEYNQPQIPGNYFYQQVMLTMTFGIKLAIYLLNLHCRRGTSLPSSIDHWRLLHFFNSSLNNWFKIKHHCSIIPKDGRINNPQIYLKTSTGKILIYKTLGFNLKLYNFHRTKAKEMDQGRCREKIIQKVKESTEQAVSKHFEESLRLAKEKVKFLII